MIKNVAVLGSGGREQALAWKLEQSSDVGKVYVIPGNGSYLNKNIENISIDVNNQNELLKFLKGKNVALTVIGPEALLTKGMTDILNKQGMLVLGPNEAAAKLEGSKIYAKELMVKYEVPTAKYIKLSKNDDLDSKLVNWDDDLGYVVKADSLASGKGVVVCDDLEQAKHWISEFFYNDNCSVNTEHILIEEKLVGKEYSFIALCDGENYIPMGQACDYKRVFEKDLGPNTGGMGGYTPHDELDSKLVNEIYEVSIGNMLKGLKSKGIHFKGFLFAGIIHTNDGYKILEYNVRFGDPEAQILLPLLEGDFFKVCEQAAKGDLTSINLELKQKSDYCVHVVMTSKNYPSIDGTQMLLKQKISLPNDFKEGVQVFCAGVENNQSGLVNSGGRVLGVSAIAKTKSLARQIAYDTVSQIKFEGSHVRNDIAQD